MVHYVIVMLVCVVATPAFAQIVGPPAPLEPGLGFVEQFARLRDQWTFALYPAARAIFWQCASVGFVLSMLRWVLSSNLETLFSAMMLRLVFVFCTFAVLSHADLWLPAIMRLFTTVGESLVGGQLDAGLVMQQGFALAGTLLWKTGNAGWLISPIVAILSALCAVVVAVAFVMIAITLLLVQIEAHIMVGMGVLMLAFMPWSGVAAVSERYFAQLIAVGIRLILIYLLVFTGQIIAPSLGDRLASETLDLTGCGMVAATAWAFWLIVQRIPQFTANLVGSVAGLSSESVVQSLRAMAGTVALATMRSEGATGGAAIGNSLGGSPVQARALQSVGRGMSSMVRGGAGAVQAVARHIPRLHPPSKPKG
jgi:P-type conjugative transfer protein TrbL